MEDTLRKQSSKEASYTWKRC
ncbi:17.7g3 protein [Bracoviriform inaniti]|uniref:17.7g3 protein n=1 Tax=Bracoviriform inaniti TaxID=36344 RepID=A8E105_9VIRU|nr:17.7g3 protein [Bracoviriform inaniti]CAO98975.1 17.7g3 protein [Bracoviriform inaniti]